MIYDTGRSEVLEVPPDFRRVTHGGYAASPGSRVGPGRRHKWKACSRAEQLPKRSEKHAFSGKLVDKPMASGLSCHCTVSYTNNLYWALGQWSYSARWPLASSEAPRPLGHIVQRDIATYVRDSKTLLAPAIQREHANPPLHPSKQKMASKERPSIRQKDIAAKAGVSQAAVSLVLSGHPLNSRVKQETRDRIERVARELQYMPNIAAQQLRGMKSGLVGVLISNKTPPVYFNRLAALERAALERKYRILVGQIGSDLDHIRQYVNDFVSRGVDGVVCMSHESKEIPGAVPEMLSQIENVVYLRRPTDRNASFVHIDAADCIRQAIDYLLSTGRKRIGMVILDEALQANRDRRQGYCESMQTHALPLEEGLIWADDGSRLVLPHEPTIGEADLVIEQLVLQSKADSIIAINDDWAAQLIKALRRRGLSVPEDVAIVGQGDFKIASFFDPEITTLDPQNEIFAESMMDLLVEMIENGKSSRQHSITVKPKLIVRQSA